MKKRTSKSVRQIKTIINNIPLYISGERFDRFGVGRVFWSTLAAEFYSRLYASYKVRSEGGSDDLGNSFAPLTKTTIAMRPIARGSLGALGLTKRSGTALQDRQRGLLSPSENKEWRQIYSRVLTSLIPRVGVDRAKQIAAATAWKKLKEKGALTKKDTLGSRDVLIMRVTDAIFNSLKPSSSGSRGYRARHNQIYEQVGKQLVLGTEVEYARFHNNTRPVIPDNAEQWASEATSIAFNAVANHIAENVI